MRNRRQMNNVPTATAYHTPYLDTNLQLYRHSCVVFESCLHQAWCLWNACDDWRTSSSSPLGSWNWKASWICTTTHTSVSVLTSSTAALLLRFGFQYFFKSSGVFSVQSMFDRINRGCSISFNVSLREARWVTLHLSMTIPAWQRSPVFKTPVCYQCLLCSDFMSV